MSDELGNLIMDLIGKVGEKQLLRILQEFDENIPCVRNPEERIKYAKHICVVHEDEIDGGQNYAKSKRKR